MMSGEEELKVEDAWKKVNDVVQEYLSSLGVNKIQYNPEVEEVLNLTRSQIRNMQDVELRENSFLLSQYSLFVQREINRHYAQLEWANQNLNALVGKYASNYGTQYTKWEEKYAMIVSDNAYAKSLFQMVKQASLRVKNLEFISGKISLLARIFSSMEKRRSFDE